MYTLITPVWIYQEKDFFGVTGIERTDRQLELL
jgi:hypothetical protein